MLRMYAQKQRSMLDEEENLKELIEQEQAEPSESNLRAEQGYVLETVWQENKQLLEVLTPPRMKWRCVKEGRGIFNFLNEINFYLFYLKIRFFY